MGRDVIVKKIKEKGECMNNQQAVGEKVAEKVPGVIGVMKGWWEKIDLEGWFGESSADAIQVAVYFVSFFAIGFLFKKYLKFIFFALLFSIVLIKGMEYYKILDVDWEALNTFLGFEPKATIGSIANMVFDWVRVNLVVTISSTLGFLLGYKLG